MSFCHNPSVKAAPPQIHGARKRPPPPGGGAPKHLAETRAQRNGRSCYSYLCQASASGMNAAGAWAWFEWQRCRTMVLSILAATGILQELSKILMPTEGQDTVGLAISLFRSAQLTLKVQRRLTATALEVSKIIPKSPVECLGRW